MSFASLVRLPDEIILEICETLAPLPNIRNLSVDPLPQGPIIALSSTCTRLRRVCWPLIFRVLRVEPIRTVSRLLSRPDWLQSTLLLQIHFSRFWIWKDEEIVNYLSDTPKILERAPHVSNLEIHVGSMTSKSAALFPHLLWCIELLSFQAGFKITNLSLVIGTLPHELNIESILVPFNRCSSLLGLRVRFPYSSSAVGTFVGTLRAYTSLERLEINTFPDLSSWISILHLVTANVTTLRKLAIEGREIYLDKTNIPAFLDSIIPFLSRLPNLDSVSLQYPIILSQPVSRPMSVQFEDSQRLWTRLIAERCPQVERIAFGIGSRRSSLHLGDTTQAIQLGTWHILRNDGNEILDMELRDEEDCEFKAATPQLSKSESTWQKLWNGVPTAGETKPRVNIVLLP